ncbi:MAG: hypothetical protein Q8N76_02570, partial [Candidatus Omnitrophota bacterium]|nr:hypothetical protein [Candidatus Omnitrophota bacterium]
SFNIDAQIIKYRGFGEHDVIWAQDLERIFYEAVDIAEKRVEAVSLAIVPSVNIYADEELIEDLHKRLESEPKDLFVGRKLANELIRAGRVDEAIGICKNLLAVILERRPEMDMDSADKNEKMTDSVLITAYIHAGRFDEAIELGLETVKKFPKDVITRNTLITAYVHACRFSEAIKSALEAIKIFPEDIVLKHILKNAYMNAGRFNEAIKLGLETVRKFPEDMHTRDLLTNAYINKAEKNVIIGEPYEKDYLSAMDLRPDDLTIKHRLIYLGLLPEDMNGIRDNSDILKRVVNIDTKEEYALTKARFGHIVSKHVDRAISGSGIANTAFPADVDVNIVKELILEAVKYGIKFNEKLPWWHHGTIIWYVGDNRPDLVEKTGIERIEVKVGKGRILTAFPKIGKGVDIYRRDFKTDAALNNILPSTSIFMWNVDSLERISVLAGRDKWGVGAMVSNDAVFGKAAPLIQREYIMWQALWKGEFIGYQKAKNGAKSGARVPVYVEFYKYEIPDELMAKYSFSNKTIYFYVDYVSRRLINVMADKPYIDFAKTGEPEISPVDSLRSPALH